ncbi:l-ascorbate oxidase-like protein [Hordeum vulgare]|nr:l-ascorbate oxidase-like protein [Hordeum vulgare]
MAEHAPLGLWLQRDDSCNEPSWVATEFTPRDFMSLARGWKSFALARGLKEGHLHYFEFDGVTTLFVKILGRAGDRVDCCMESGNINCSSSSDNGNSSTSSGRSGSNDREDSPGIRVKEEDSD